MTESRSVVTWRWGGGGMRLIISAVVMISRVYTYVKTCQIVHYKYVQFIICQLYLHNAVFQKLSNMYRLLYINYIVYKLYINKVVKKQIIALGSIIMTRAIVYPTNPPLIGFPQNYTHKTLEKLCLDGVKLR